MVIQFRRRPRGGATGVNGESRGRKTPEGKDETQFTLSDFLGDFHMRFGEIGEGFDCIGSI